MIASARVRDGDDDVARRAVVDHDDVRTFRANAEVVLGARAGEALRVTLDARAGRGHVETTGACADGRVRGMFRGSACELVVDGSRVVLRRIAGRGMASETFVRRFSGWATVLETAARAGTYPAAYEDVECVSVERLCGLDELRARVNEDPSFWADGSPKDFRGLSEDEHALLNAGEIIAFQLGKRPMCMVQLWTGWEDDVSHQNVDMPFVATLLKEITEDDQVDVITVSPPGATDKLGLTALLYPKRSPYKERAKYLASFGAQAAIVAGSAYYQTLIGRCLGYKEENILAHVQQYNKGVGYSKEVSELVDKELNQMSSEPVVSNWRHNFPELKPSDRKQRKKRGKKSSSVEDVELLFGRKRK